MDGFVFIALFAVGLAALIGTLLATLAIRLTREVEYGRGHIVLGALLLPTIFLIYLLSADHLRNEFHRSRGEAYDTTAPLAGGYELTFFDKEPWDASIFKVKKSNPASGIPDTISPMIRHVRRLALKGAEVAGERGLSDTGDGPSQYFLLDTSSGNLLGFHDKDGLNKAAGFDGPLQAPEEYCRRERDGTRSFFFLASNRGSSALPCAFILNRSDPS